jgi:hypothetical protein
LEPRWPRTGPKYRSHPEVVNLIKNNNASRDANNTIDQLVRILAVLNSYKA